MSLTSCGCPRTWSAGERQTGELTALLVGVEDLGRAVADKGFFQRLDAEFGIHADRYAPGEHPPARTTRGPWMRLLWFSARSQECGRSRHLRRHVGCDTNTGRTNVTGGSTKGTLKIPVAHPSREFT